MTQTSRLLSEERKQQLDRDFKAERDQLLGEQCVCEALKDIGLEASLPTLEKLSQDSHSGVASKAKEAIREIGRPVSERTHLRQRQ